MPTRFPFFISLFFVSAALLFRSEFAVAGPQKPVVSAENARFKHFSIEQGLSNNIASAILQDKKGFIWLGTEDGLNKFNGYSWTVYKHDPQDSSSISFGSITTLYEDKNGFIWIGMDGGGVNIFNPFTGTFRHLIHDAKNQNSIVSNHVKCIYEDKEGLFWFATWNGVNSYEVKKNRYTLYQHSTKDPHSISDNDVKCITEDADGQLWIGTRFGLNSFDKSKQAFTGYYSQAGNTATLSSNDIMCISRDAAKAGVLWIGTIEGLNRLDKNRKTITQYKYNKLSGNKGPNNNDIKAILDDKEGHLWLGTFGGGLNAFDKKTEQFTWFVHSDANYLSISENYVKSIFKDKEGILWIGTTDGLNALNAKKSPFSYFKSIPSNPNSLSNNSVWAFCPHDSARLWIGTKNGLNDFNKTKSRFIPVPEVLRKKVFRNNINCLYQDQFKTLWIGTSEGLYTYNTSTGKLQINKFLGRQAKISFIFEDTEGLVWIGSYEGLFILNRKRKGISQVAVGEGYKNRYNLYFYCGLQDKDGTLWFGTFGAGLFYLNKKSKALQQLNNWPGKSNGGNHYIINLFSDGKGLLWIGTYGEGLYSYDKSLNRFELYTIKDGLPSNVINGITKDAKNQIWVSTNNGLSRMKPDAPNFDKFRNYDKNAGLKSLDFNSGAVYKDHADRLYFGASNGMVTFYPDSLSDNEQAPPVVVSKFKVLEQEFPLDSDITFKKHIVLKYSQNLFSFEFSALSFLAPENNQYAYKMEGLDTGWVRAKNRHYVSYTNLDPGNYTFKVRGASPLGVWNNAGASVRITITPPFWKEKWFEFLMGTLLILVMYFIIKFSKQNLEKQKELHEVSKKIAEFKLIALRSQMNPHFIFNSLSSIQYFITSNNKDAAINYLSKFAKLIRQILENSINNRILISEEIDFIRCYLELESLRFENRLEYFIIVDEEIDTHNTEIPSMLIQPFIENSIIHGLMNKDGKGILKILLQNQNNFITCTIEDNGVGRKEAGRIKKTKIIKNKSVGMAVTNDRLEILNRDQAEKLSMEIKDLYDENNNPSGTRVIIRIPIEF